jgi:hypothetical protein
LSFTDPDQGTGFRDQRSGGISAKLFFAPDGQRKLFLKDEHRTSNVQHPMMNKKTNEIKLQSGATSLFDVQRWTFDVRCSVCFNVHLSKKPRKA